MTDTTNTEPERFPFPGARMLLTGGVESARRAAAEPKSDAILVNLVQGLADTATVLLFGNDQQRHQVEAWMHSNREKN